MPSREDSLPGNEGPRIITPPPGPKSRAWLKRALESSVPMGPPRSLDCGIVYERGVGANVWDPDGNRYVDLAAGFGALLLGHGHPRILQSVREQSTKLMMALGDLYPSTARLAFEERLRSLLGLPDWQMLLGQSGSDAITAALKTAVLTTGKPSVLAFSGAYHGLGHAPLSICGLREGYRSPFLEQLNPAVEFLPYPANREIAAQVLEHIERVARSSALGAVVIEPILGRGGCIEPPLGFLSELSRVTRDAGVVLIADEIWTGLGRAGSLSYCQSQGVTPDLLCLGKGLGGGLPISACLGRPELMKHWQRRPEVVHTATFAGASLSCAAASATLDVIDEQGLAERSFEQGAKWLSAIAEACIGLPVVEDVRGRGFMIAVDFRGRAGLAATVMFKLLEQGYITTTGGGKRDVLILTPPLTIDGLHLSPFVSVLKGVLSQLTTVSP